MSDSTLRFEDEEEKIPVQTQTPEPKKMDMGNGLPPFLGGTASLREQMNEGLGIGASNDVLNPQVINPSPTTPTNLTTQTLSREQLRKILEEI
jgi:hypothetical protein